MKSQNQRKKNYPYPLPKRRPFFNLILKLIRLLKKPPLVTNLNKTLASKAIFVSNHSGASGPMNLALFFPSYFVPWGAHPMVGNYRSRWKYLYYIFYRQKLGYKPFRSFLIATLFAIISKRLYRGMDLIPTYEDIRLVQTFRTSADMIQANKPILVFPEDSSKGYLDTILHYHEGFLAFAEFYFRHYGEDLPIYPVGFSKKKNAIIIEKPFFLQELYRKGMTRHEAAQFFKDQNNQLVARLISEN